MSRLPALARWIAAAVVLAAAPAALAQRAGPGVTDTYGYAVVASPAAPCAAQFMDISSTGTAIVPTASGAAAALDDGGAVLALALPFQLYGRVASSLVVSTNGYLAMADTLAAEDGGDFSNDCPAPAIPDNANAAGTRIMAYHDELDGTGAGTLHTQHFANCPRTAASGQAEACTVVQWTDWGRVQGAGTSTFQAVLYHGSNEIALQYAAVDSTGGASATIGAQDLEAGSAALASCDSAASVSAGQAICLLAPARLDDLFRDGFED